MTLLWATHLISLQNGKSKERGRRVDAIDKRLHLWALPSLFFLFIRLLPMMPMSEIRMLLPQSKVRSEPESLEPAD